MSLTVVAPMRCGSKCCDATVATSSMSDACSLRARPLPVVTPIRSLRALSSTSQIALPGAKCGPQNFVRRIQMRIPSRINSSSTPTPLPAPAPAQKVRFQSPDDEKSIRCILNRRDFMLSAIANFALVSSYQGSQAKALGDPSVTINDVTPSVSTPGVFSPLEKATIDIFDNSTYSVVNIFDTSLRPQANITGYVEVPEGNGSGIVWDTQGNIVTNYHVIGSSLQGGGTPGKVVARVIVLSPDGFQNTFDGVLVGADKSNDLAVIKIEAPAGLLRTIETGSMKGLQVGQRVLAIGNPFGFDHTLTVGILSGLRRDIRSQTGAVISDGIQTDAAINPGNSGGPLLDSRGRLIGINTAIFTRTGTSSGVGFAIPISTVSRVVPQLISFGKVIRPGLNVQLANDLIAKQLNIKTGALVLAVPENTNAFKAGLLPTKRGLTGNISVGDVIIEIDNNPVSSYYDVTKILDNYRVGDTVTIRVRRGEDYATLSLALEESSRPEK